MGTPADQTALRIAVSENAAEPELEVLLAISA